MLALALEKTTDPHDEELISYLSAEGGYWIKNDKWSADSAEYKSLNLGVLRDNRHIIADFSGYKNENIKIEVKYALLKMIKEEQLTAYTLNNLYSTAIKLLGLTLGADLSLSTLLSLDATDNNELNTVTLDVNCLLKEKYIYLKKSIIRTINE